MTPRRIGGVTLLCKLIPTIWPKMLLGVILISALPGELLAEKVDLSSHPIDLHLPDELSRDRAKIYGPIDPVATRTNHPVQLSIAPPFVPEDLEKLVRTVNNADASVLAGQLAKIAAQSEVRSARWLRFPSAAAGFDYDDQSKKLAPSIELSVPIWSGGSLASNLRRSKEQFRSADAQLAETALALSIETSEIYFSYVNSSRLIGIYEDSVAAHAGLVESMERRVSQEISPLSDLELARSRLAQIEQELSELYAQRETALSLLRELANDPSVLPASDQSYAEAINGHDWSDAVSESLSFSPTLKRLGFDARAAYADKSIAKSNLFPQVSGYYRHSDALGSTVGISTRIQTGNGLSQFSAISTADARAKELESRALLAARQLRQSVLTDLAALKSARARAIISTTAAVNAQRVSESYKRQFITGRRSWLDLMNSLRENLQAAASREQAEVSAMALNVKLALNTGLWGVYTGED